MAVNVSVQGGGGLYVATLVGYVAIKKGTERTVYYGAG